MKRNKHLAWLLLLIPVLLVALLYWRFSADPLLSAEQLRQQGFWLHTERPVVRIPTLADHLGGEFSQADLQGKWSWIFFGYTHCPDICGPSVALMHRAGQLLLGRNWRADEIQMLMVSVDPTRDTPQTMAAFAARRNPQLRGLLPNGPQLKSLATSFHSGYGEIQNGLIDHTGRIILVDPGGRYLGFFPLTHHRGQVSRNLRTIAQNQRQRALNQQALGTASEAKSGRKVKVVISGQLTVARLRSQMPRFQTQSDTG